MLTTPLKVFASIQRRETEHIENAQQLSVRQDPSSQPILIVHNTGNHHNTEGDTESEIQFTYSDCHYTTPDQLLYTEQLERLITSAIQGYSSAGVFINSRVATYDEIGANLINTVLNILRHSLANENIQRRIDQKRQLKVGYGYLGFCDDACFDYRTDRVISNSTAMESLLSTMIRPIDTIGDVIDKIVSQPRRVPSVIVFHLSDGHQFDSTFAWIDLHPPMSDFGQQIYYKSYREFESLLKTFSNVDYMGTISPYQYAMSHMLFDFFSGSHQTAVFAHFEEYGRYTFESDLDVLEYASQLQNIRCYIPCGRNNIVQHVMSKEPQILELQGEVRKLYFLLEKYKSASMADHQEISRLTNKSTLDDRDYLKKRLITTRNSANAAMERQNATTAIQIADMKHQIDELKIELVKSMMVVNSFRCTVGDLELYIEELKGMNLKLDQAHANDTIRIGELQAQVNHLMTRLKKNINGDLIDDPGREWLVTEGQYIQEGYELKSDKERLTREVDILSLERKRLLARVDSLRLEMDTKIARLQRTHVMELEELENSSQQRLEKMLAEKDKEITLMQDDLEFCRSQLRAALMENSTGKKL